MQIKTLIERDLRAGKTQREIAEAIGISQGSVNNILAGYPLRQPKAILKLATYYKLNPTELLFPNAEIVPEEPGMFAGENGAPYDTSEDYEFLKVVHALSPEGKATWKKMGLFLLQEESAAAAHAASRSTAKKTPKR